MLGDNLLTNKATPESELKKKIQLSSCSSYHKPPVNNKTSQ